MSLLCSYTAWLLVTFGLKCNFTNLLTYFNRNFLNCFQWIAKSIFNIGRFSFVHEKNVLNIEFCQKFVVFLTRPPIHMELHFVQKQEVCLPGIFRLLHHAAENGYLHSWCWFKREKPDNLVHNFDNNNDMLHRQKARADWLVCIQLHLLAVSSA